MNPGGQSRRKLVAVTLDEASIGRGSPDQEHERAIALYDLVQDNSFALPGRDDGPYALRVALQDGRLTLTASGAESGAAPAALTLSLTPLRPLLKDYLLICESYYAAVRTASAERIEAIDHGRRTVHDEAGALLGERLAEQFEVDTETARRLFTLLVALHRRA